jgi:DNA-binding GntR family transcriptional regulator
MQQTAMQKMMKLEAPKNLTALAFESIKAYILREDLDEDTRLTEEFLSKQLGISKSPVREALNSLHTEGLIRIEARRGAYLRRFSAKEVKDLYDLREALELHAVSYTVVTPRLIAELRKSVHRTRKLLRSNDRLGHIEEDTRFHELIAASAGNDELCRVLANVHSQIWLCRRKTYDLSASTAPDAHLAIIDALEEGNRKEAQNAMRNHIDLVRQRLIAFIQKREGRQE